MNKQNELEALLKLTWIGIVIAVTFYVLAGYMGFRVDPIIQGGCRPCKHDLCVPLPVPTPKP